MPTLNRRTEQKKQGRYNRDLYQSHRWHEYSRQYRKKHPLCVHCLSEGKTHISEVVDHKIPIQQGGEIWNHENHQALCIKHHNQKSAHERRSGNKA